jgi:prolyl oligopeptidase
LRRVAGKQAGNNPTLIRIMSKGARSWKIVSATIQENVDIQAFTLYNMGFKALPKQNKDLC